MKARSVGMFVQIGNLAINMALVIKVGFSAPGTIPSSVWLYFIPGQDDKPKPVVLKGDRHAAFLDWWERQAVQTGPQFVYTTGSEDGSWPPVLCNQAKK